MCATQVQPFALHAHPSAPAASPFVVYGGLTYQAPWLTVRFTVQGITMPLVLPPPSQCPGRQDGLWAYTCFELFLAPLASQTYWEVNVSPGGDWNTYHFETYRQDMYPEALLQVSQITSRHQPEDTFTLSFQMDMAALLRAYACIQGVLECSPCCILVEPSQHKSYWAMQHQPSRPDFHRRASFMLRLPLSLPPTICA